MDSATKKSIKKHIKSVQFKLFLIMSEIQKRLESHDDSKLHSPELPLWEAMDKEPKYPYGSKEYIDKQKRYYAVFKHHYACNRHHPEHFENGIKDMNLVDLIEMLADWISYKDSLSITEAIELVYVQAKRFGFSDETISYMVNTLVDYFVTLGGVKRTEPDRIDKERIPVGQIIDIRV